MSMNDSDEHPVLEQAEEFKRAYAAVREQITRVIVGQDEIIDGRANVPIYRRPCLAGGCAGAGQDAVDPIAQPGTVASV